MIITRAQPNLNCFKLSECLDYTRTIHIHTTTYTYTIAHTASVKLNTEEAKPNTVKKKSTQQYY